MNHFIVYHHKTRRFAEYINHYSDIEQMVDAKRATSEIRNLPDNHTTGFAELPDELRRLLFFAKPDVVICYDNGILPIRPVFAFELTNHVPARDHWLQRFNNLVGCAQVGVPGAYVLPFDLSQHSSFPSKLDSAFFYAYDRVMEIHQTPFYIAEWESADQKNLNIDASYADLPVHDSEPMKKTMAFLNKVLTSAINGTPANLLFQERMIVELRDDMRRRAYSPIPKIEDFARLKKNMVNGDFLSWVDIQTWLRDKGIDVPANIPDRIIKRTRNLIFTPIAEERGKNPEQLRKSLNTRIKDKGADPYLGQPLAFDYIFCRLGKTPYERDANLIIDLSMLSFEDFSCYHSKVWEGCPLQHNDLTTIRNIPEYTMFLTEGCAQVMKNFLRVYAFTADLIVFKEGLVYFS
ncbi:MAG: hypothetical protein IJC04_01800 [Oscillospiraceae bacterium]|nr:hypothetical protein [Oscillospiraceae bacterium]